MWLWGLLFGTIGKAFWRCDLSWGDPAKRTHCNIKKNFFSVNKPLLQPEMKKQHSAQWRNNKAFQDCQARATVSLPLGRTNEEKKGKKKRRKNKQTLPLIFSHICRSQTYCCVPGKEQCCWSPSLQSCFEPWLMTPPCFLSDTPAQTDHCRLKSTPCHARFHLNRSQV